MSVISSLGIGSGLDLASIVEGLVEAERAPTEARLDSKRESVTAELSAFGALKSSVALFRGSLGSLKLKTSLSEQQIKLSDASVFSVDLTSEADIGSFSVEVEALATKHSLATHPDSAFADINDEIGSGDLTLRFGATDESPYSFTQDTSKPTHTITVSQQNNNTTLSGLKNYINENDFGIHASIINDGSGYRLVFTSDETGASNSMEITVSNDADADDSDNAGLSQLAFNAAAQNSAVQTVAAQDASLNINGLGITRETNTIEGAIDGVTLNLFKADLGNSIAVELDRNYASAQAGIREFIDGYNGLVRNIKTLTSYNAESGSAGLLLGDFTVRNILNQLENEMSRNLTSQSNIRSLADLGITTQTDGSLAIDSDALDQAFNDFPDEVEAFFINQGNATDSGISYLSANIGVAAGNYSVFVNSPATQGSLAGGQVNNLTIDPDNDEFVINVDGVTSGTITLAQGAYADGDALAEHIQSQINADAGIKDGDASVSVVYDSSNNVFDINSSLYGARSSIELVSVDVGSENDLGLAIGAGDNGEDVEGLINGQDASGNGKILTSSGSFGISVEVVSGITGNRGVISISEGIVTNVDNLLAGFMRFDGIIKVREDGLNERLLNIAQDREELDLRIASVEARFIKQFAALDGLIAQFNSTSSFLESQLNNLVEPNSIGRR